MQACNQPKVYQNNQPSVCQNNNMGWLAIHAAQSPRHGYGVGHVDTKRPVMTNRAKAENYLDSVQGNPAIDIHNAKEVEETLSYLRQNFASHVKSVQNDPRMLVSDLARLPELSLVSVSVVGNDDPQLRLAALPTIIDTTPDRAMALIRLRNMRYGDPYLFVRRDYWKAYSGEQAHGVFAKANFIALERHGKDWPDALEKHLKKHPSAFVFLTPQEHREWMSWRRAKGLPANFPHLRMSDYDAKKPTPGGYFSRGRTFSELSTTEQVTHGVAGAGLLLGGGAAVAFAAGYVAGGGAAFAVSTAASVVSSAAQSAVGFAATAGGNMAEAAVVALGDAVGSTVGSAVGAAGATVLTGIAAGLTAGAVRLRNRGTDRLVNPVNA